MESIYFSLTRRFNEGRLRAVLIGGQAVVMLRLAFMSKDGDWLLRDDEETLGHILTVLEEKGARYRFGAPLDLRWLENGWSSHFEFKENGLRVRTDFVTKPPRLSAQDIAAVWQDQATKQVPHIGPKYLAELKKTNREKDYPIIGELARLVDDPLEQMLLSRSARDIISLCEQHPGSIEQAMARRPALAAVLSGREALEAALDAERRELIKRNEERLSVYQEMAKEWAEAWPSLALEIEDLPLRQAHQVIVSKAEHFLPMAEGGPKP